MKIRELLQYEIWSKETTRKILVWSGYVFGSLLVAVGVAMFWLTPGEHMMGRAALTQIDALDKVNPESEQFDAETKTAEEIVEGAKRTAFTIRDKNVVQALSGYLMIVEMKRDEAKTRRVVEEFNRRYPGRIHPDPERDRESAEFGVDVRHILSERLHAALDYKGLDF